MNLITVRIGTWAAELALARGSVLCDHVPAGAWIAGLQAFCADRLPGDGGPHLPDRGQPATTRGRRRVADRQSGNASTSTCRTEPKQRRTRDAADEVAAGRSYRGRPLI